VKIDTLKKENILTIPGTTKLANLESNLGAADVTLTAAERQRLDALAEQVAGERYDARGMAAINR
jgi:aryl-alcohol dehydrogenase-like predicted oxidoreductase